VKVVAVTFPVVNSGNTPTKHLRSVIDCHPVGLDTPSTVDPFSFFRWEDSRSSRQVIGPKQTVDFGPCDLAEEDILNAYMGTVRRYLMGEIRYQDTLVQIAL